MKTANLRTVTLAEVLNLPVHPVADLFPMLPNQGEICGSDRPCITLSDLADSILENGLQEPILLFSGQILNGRNRRAACVLVVEALGSVSENYELQVQDFIGTEEEADKYVIALNVHRRDLTPGQQVFIRNSLKKRGIN